MFKIGCVEIDDVSKKHLEECFNSKESQFYSELKEVDVIFFELNHLSLDEFEKLLAEREESIFIGIIEFEKIIDKYKELKARKNLFLIEKPLQDQHLQSILSKVKDKKEGSNRHDLKELFAKYDLGIPEKIVTLEFLAEKVRNSNDRSSILELRQGIHKLAGNASSYGYRTAGKICLDFQNQLDMFIEQNKVNLNIDDYLKNIRFYMQFRDKE